MTKTVMEIATKGVTTCRSRASTQVKPSQDNRNRTKTTQTNIDKGEEYDDNSYQIFLEATRDNIYMKNYEILYSLLTMIHNIFNRNHVSSASDDATHSSLYNILCELDLLHYL